MRQIAAAMDRAPSTIARELKRNSGTQVELPACLRTTAGQSRRWKGSRLLRQPELQKEVLKRLEYGWSPAQVAGRLRKEKGRKVISYESIYRFIDAQIRRTKDYSWRHYLPRAKAKRGWRGRRGGRRSTASRGASLSIGARPTFTNAANRAIGKRTYALCQVWPGCSGCS